MSLRKEGSYGLVVISKDAYVKMSKFVLEHAGPAIPDKSKWREVFGLLGGRVNVGNCLVTEFFPMAVGESNYEVRLGPADYVRAVQFEEELRQRDERLFHCGWMHSHFIGHEFSGVDVENQLGWQAPNPYAFGLVYDPQLLSDENPGVCVLKLQDVSMGEASPVDSLDFVIQKVRGNYETLLREELPEVFEVRW
ncbi:MAG: hypothetical protein Kow0069_20980 [Promethearchaeota archaeon]